MSHPVVAIPEKLFFKIGEVCELAGVQAHVLRYWESEFPTLAPQKNRAGQRVYRKRDVEMALRIKELLYDDQYTIAGAKKRLATEVRSGTRLKVVSAEPADESFLQPGLLEVPVPSQSFASPNGEPSTSGRTAEERRALRKIAAELRELLGLLEAENKNSTPTAK
ncbi:MAG TPA: MerR family transcriptional regulator [Pyrinomonadaceae bacterium]|jgi:DNA-binding transcriptional MerR regulator|nr:MerR family transcriptional regulator [Pyrinomonadaceae bacterium]